MKKLRQLIHESIGDYMKAIEEAGEMAGHKSKMEAAKEAIEKRDITKTLNKLEEEEKMMIDEKKVKEMANEKKALEKYLAKLQKQLDKLESKLDKAPKVKEEEEKEIVDETMMDEGETADKLFQMFKDENLLNDRREYDAEDFMGSYPDLSKEEAEKLENMLQNPDNLSESDDANIYEMLHMQKLAGIISESEYKVKVEEAKKKKASAGMTKKEKSEVAKKARAGKDIGKKGKGFKDVAKAAGGGEKGKKIAAAAMWKGEAKKAKGLKEEVLALFEGEYKLGQTVNFNEEPVKILAVSSYEDNKKEIDASIYEMGWEQQTEASKEELTWYKINFLGEDEWVDNEELDAFNM
jgi:hypothetical protein